MSKLDGVKPLTFIDYFKIRETARVQNTPEEMIGVEVQLHDKDTLTYKQAYDMLSKLLSDVVKYTDTYGSLNMDTVTALCVLLHKKGILTKEDIDIIKANVEKDWSNQDEKD